MTGQSRRSIRYGLAILTVVITLALLALPEIGPGLGGLLFLAVFLAARLGGRGPGLLATALITAVAALDLASHRDPSPGRIAPIALFAGGGVAITALVEGLDVARGRAVAGERRLAAVLAGIGDAVIATDASGRVSFLNPVAAALTGWTPEEAAGHPLPEVFQILDEGTRAAVESSVGRALREGAVVGLADHTVLVARDGTSRLIDGGAAPVKDEGGAITGAVLVFRDVTRCRQDEAGRARLAAIVESSNDAIIAKDLDGIVTAWNGGAERLFGYAAAEIIGRPIALLIPPDLEREEAAILGRIRRGEGVTHYESVRVARDGRRIDVSATISPIRDASGRVVGGSRIMRDITERRRSAEALEQRARLLDQAFDPILVWELDGGIVSWNAGARELYGYTAAEALGRVSHDLLGTAFPGGRESFLAGLRHAGRWDGELRHRAKDGRWVTVDCRMALDQPPGRPAIVLETNRDVTERRRAEAELLRHARRLENLRAIDLAILASRTPREIAESALQHLGPLIPWWTAGVATYDLERGLIEVIANDGPLRDWYPPGTTVRDPLGDRPEIVALREGRFAVAEDVAGTDLASPLMARLRDAGMRSYLLAPLQDRGRLIGGLLLASDRPAAFATDHIEMASEVADQLAIALRQALLFEEVRAANARLEALSRQLLRAQEDERRRISRELHDEVGQALTAVKLMLDRLARDPGAAGLAPRLADAAALAHRALEQVRDLSRLLSPAALEDLGLAEALRALAEGLAERAGLVAEADVEEVDPCDPGVELACYRIAQEALTNAVKHSGGTRLRLALRRTGAELELVVEDDGAGFDVEAATARAAGGASLGLLGLRERAALAGGRAEVASRPGGGTRVSAVVPARARGGDGSGEGDR